MRFDIPERQSVLQALKESRLRGPAVIPIVVAVASAIAAKKAADAAKKKAEQTEGKYDTAAGRTSDFATNTLVPRGTTITNAGQAETGQAANYYSTLLGGSRGAMQAATAAPAAQISDTYAGAERSLAPGDRSGTASLQRAELEREKVGQISRLTAGVQPQAAQALGTLGVATTGQGLGALAGAGQLYGGLVNPAANLAGQQNAINAQQQQQFQEAMARVGTAAGGAFGGGGGGAAKKTAA